jgi:hypothetical protein
MTTASKTAGVVTGAVAPDHKHIDKFIEPDELLVVDGTSLKWHNLAVADVPLEVRDLARDFLRREAAAGKLDDLGDLGFVILHRCGEDFYFLIVNSWRNANEVWESVYAKQNSGQADFDKVPLAAHHHAAFCVWELAAVWHEQQAWKRFLLSARDDDARDAYLTDRYRGPA